VAMLFDIVVPATNRATPHALEIGHAIRRPRCRVGRELRLLRQPRLGLREFRSVWRIEGLAVPSCRQHQDENHGGQRRESGEKPIAHLIPLFLRAIPGTSPTQGWPKNVEPGLSHSCSSRYAPQSYSNSSM